MKLWGKSLLSNQEKGKIKVHGQHPHRGHFYMYIMPLWKVKAKNQETLPFTRCKWQRFVHSHPSSPIMTQLVSEAFPYHLSRKWSFPPVNHHNTYVNLIFGLLIQYIYPSTHHTFTKCLIENRHRLGARNTKVSWTQLFTDKSRIA